MVRIGSTGKIERSRRSEQDHQRSARNARNAFARHHEREHHEELLSEAQRDSRGLGNEDRTRERYTVVPSRLKLYPVGITKATI